VLLLLVFRLVQLSARVPGLNLLSGTLARASAQIFQFLVVLCIILAAFAGPFMMIFSQALPEFVDGETTMFQLFRGLLGDMPIDDMLAVNASDGMWLYVLFTGLIVIIMMNIVIAILTDAFEAAKEQMFAEPLDPPVADLFRAAGCGYVGIGVQLEEGETDTAPVAEASAEAKAPTAAENLLHELGDNMTMAEMVVMPKEELARMQQMLEGLQNSVDLLTQTMQTNSAQSGMELDSVNPLAARGCGIGWITSESNVDGQWDMSTPQSRTDMI